MFSCVFWGAKVSTKVDLLRSAITSASSRVAILIETLELMIDLEFGDAIAVLQNEVICQITNIQNEKA